MTQTKRALPAVTLRRVWGGSVLLSSLAWIPMVQQSRSMPSVLGRMGMPLGSFLVFWTLMIVAMMGPSLAPIASLHVETVRRHLHETHGPPLVARGGAFVLGYLLVWFAVGLPIFGLAALAGRTASTVPPVAPAAGALILVGAGFYQLTPLQARCLASCNWHLCAQAHLPKVRSLLQDVSFGLAHGVDCVGACGGCMVVFAAVGLMNLPWMIAITLIVLVEKVWRHGHHVAAVVGIGLLLLGIFAAAAPRLILGL